MLSCWQDQIVVTPGLVTRPLAKALLEAGAKAVVCREAGSQLSQAATQAMPAFFAALYRVLLSGRPVLKALSQAGKPSTWLSALCSCVPDTGFLSVRVPKDEASFVTGAKKGGVQEWLTVLCARSTSCIEKPVEKKPRKLLVRALCGYLDEKSRLATRPPDPCRPERLMRHSGVLDVLTS